MGKPDALIVDMDGTLVNVSSLRHNPNTWMGRLMSTDFDLDWSDHSLKVSERDKNDVTFFGKPYRWRGNDGRLELQPQPAPAIRLGQWDCCGRPRIL